MKFVFRDAAIRDLKKLDGRNQAFILRKILSYMNSNDPLSFAEHLHDCEYGQFRFRVGDFRVIFDLGKDKVIILRIGNRKDIYI